MSEEIPSPKKRGPRKGQPWSAERRAAYESRQRKPSAPATQSHAEIVAGMVNTLSVPFMALGRVNDTFLADALTLQMHAEPLGQAVEEVAKVNPAVAQFLEKGAPATPYLLLGTTLLGLGAQLATNHGVRLPFGGSIPKDALVVEMKNRMADAQKAAEEQQRYYEEMAAQARQEQEEPVDFADEREVETVI